MNILKRELKTFILAICAGICIGIGGTVFLASPNNIIGAFLFCVGLLTILVFKFNLYTGMLGYVLDNKPSYLFTVLVVWCGNFVGTALTALLVKSTRSGDALAAKAQALAQTKLNDKLISLFILGIFCGILMYLAVETYKHKELGDIFRFAALFLCVALFILSGFEHCIANMYYFSVAGVWSCNTLLMILLMTLGNSLGGWLLPLADKFRK